MTGECQAHDNFEIVKKIETAYRVYKMSEMFLKDVNDDYGKEKIARLRLEFAHHQLMKLIEEAVKRGIKWDSSEMLKKHFYSDL